MKTMSDRLPDAPSSAQRLHQAQMSEKDFNRFREFIHTEVGIHLATSKKTMVEARLRKRLRRLGLESFKEYLAYVHSKDGEERELLHLIDSITTNTTDFFREPKHFRYLEQTVLPQWMKSQPSSRGISVWSAGCSIGMEPYTLAIVLQEYQERHADFDYSILATDISTQALEQAARGVYEQERIAPVTEDFRRKYFLRSRDKTKQLVRIVPELRRKVSFRRLNFMEDFHFSKPFDIIFCRNVIIYFDRPTQERLFQRLCGQLRPGGHLFIGHSESLSGIDLPLRSQAPTIYQRL